MKKVIIENSKVKEILSYYKTHNREDTCSHFNISERVLRRVAEDFNFVKSKEDIDLTKRLTNLRRYGVERYVNPEKVSKTCTEHRNNLIKDITEDDFIGYYSTHSKGETKKHFGIKDNAFDELLDKYNYTKPLTLVAQETKKTKEKRYGDPNYNNRDKSVETYKKTCIEKYGVDNYAKTEGFMSKCSAAALNSIAKDGTHLRSSWEVKFYEHCLDKGYNIDLNIPIKYDYKGEQHVTFIDFKVNGQLYEVKGTHLLHGVFDYDAVPIEVKLKVYKDNGVIIVTDELQEHFPNNRLISIDNLSI